jgi:hypothetical protein
VRVAAPADVPTRDPAAIDVAILDMNHGYANVGHDAIVAIVRDAALGLDTELARRGRRIRVLSYDVRGALAVPEHDGRHRLFLGTGGPGHLDPRQNTLDDGTRTIREDPAWEPKLWELFAAIASDESTALYAVCHTFGLLCRWSGVADAKLRGPEKGGAMSGVGTNVLTSEALEHPWFAPLVRSLVPPDRVPVLDSRYYDLVPPARDAAPRDATSGLRPIAIAHEEARDGAPGDALTMLELARDPGGVPRIFGVNSHPEIGSPERVEELLARLLALGTIDETVHAQRSAVLPTLRDDRREARMLVGRYVFSDLVRERVARLVAA